MAFIEQINKALDILDEDIKLARKRLKDVSDERDCLGRRVLQLDEDIEGIQKGIDDLIKEKKELERHANEYT